MKANEIIRNFGFEMLDLVRGGQVKHNISELAYYLNNNEVAQIQNENRLLKLLTHACETTPYYKLFKGFRNISDFPVIQKSAIRDNTKKFLSDKYRLENLQQVRTSGSYGTPMFFYHTKDKTVRRIAEILFYNSWVGYKVGAKFLFVRIKDKSRIKAFLENEYSIKPFKINDDWLLEISKYIHDKKFSYFVGYPSVINALANYISYYKLNKPECIKGIITFAEPLYGEVKNNISKAFECPVAGRYSSEELGVIAHQCPHDNHYHVNESSYFIEILDLEEDKPLSPGEKGRIVITDLFSMGMPLIRYDLGDIGIIERKSGCPYGELVLKHIEGRMIETIYDTNGRALSPLMLVGPLSRTIPGIMQFQFAQNDVKSYSIKMVINDMFDESGLNNISEKLYNILGKDADLKYIYVDDLPPLPSGKRPYFINECNGLTDY